MFKTQLEQDLKKAVESLDYQQTDPDLIGADIVCSIPASPQFGDYTTNIALQLAKQNSTDVKQSSIEIAKQILSSLSSLSYLEKTEVAGPGFINFFIKDQVLIENIEKNANSKANNLKKILIEYGGINPLKEIHIGHLRNFILGESLARIFESLGHTVFRANYQGDIGLHIAKAIWGIKRLGLPTKKLNLEEKAEFLGKAYAEGSKFYEEDSSLKKEIDEINSSLYNKDPNLREIYIIARSWSLEYFEPIYRLLGIKYDRCFFESEVFEDGKKTVLENVGKVFELSNGAVIFPGEKYDLHNRVFITSAGNPTYEGKDVGLARLEYDTFNFEKAIHVVASEQAGYFQVVIKAIELLFPYIKGKEFHLSYGVVDLKVGKMSSRTGNVVTADDLIGVVSEKVREIMKEGELIIDQDVVRKVALGAIKYSYLKFSPQPNMVFDLEKSVSLQGDSGPYIQYTYARIQSVLRKAQTEATSKESGSTFEVNSQERQILVKLLHFAEILDQAANSYHPNVIAEYLSELARLYNLFYQEQRIIGSEKENFRLKISKFVAEVLKKGLYLLGIEAPERM